MQWTVDSSYTGCLRYKNVHAGVMCMGGSMLTKNTPTRPTVHSIHLLYRTLLGDDF